MHCVLRLDMLKLEIKSGRVTGTGDSDLEVLLEPRHTELPRFFFDGRNDPDVQQKYTVPTVPQLLQVTSAFLNSVRYEKSMREHLTTGLVANAFAQYLIEPRRAGFHVIHGYQAISSAEIRDEIDKQLLAYDGQKIMSASQFDVGPVLPHNTGLFALCEGSPQLFLDLAQQLNLTPCIEIPHDQFSSGNDQYDGVPKGVCLRTYENTLMLSANEPLRDPDSKIAPSQTQTYLVRRITG